MWDGERRRMKGEKGGVKGGWRRKRGEESRVVELVRDKERLCGGGT